MRVRGMTLSLFCVWVAAAGPVEIQVAAEPALPVRNLLEADNPGFEEGFAKWGCDLASHGTNGLLVELSGDAAVGTKALHVDTREALPALNLGWGQGNFSLTKILPTPEKLFAEGRQYVLSCLARSDAAGSGYSGLGLAHYTRDWKAAPSEEKIEATAVIRGPTGGAWRRFTSEPFTYRKTSVPTFFSLCAGVVYERNRLSFDEIGIYPAFSDLKLRVRGTGLLQVVVQDERDEVVCCSPLFTAPETTFATNIRVSAVGRYRIKTVDDRGRVTVKAYPDAPTAQAQSGLFIGGDAWERVTTVAVSANAPALERAAADEAVRILGRMTGAAPALAVTNALPAQGTGGLLVIGSSLSGGAVSGDELKALGDGYIVRVDGGRITVAGTEPYYSLQGVYRFFTRLGCAFYVRHDPAFWENEKTRPTVETYPQDKRLMVGAGWSEKPRFVFLGESKRGNPRETRERKAGVYGHMWDHNADLLVPYSVHGKTHPEYYALRPGGKRLVPAGSMTVHLCMTNPDVQRIAAENVINWIEQQPEREFFDVMQGDGPEWCVCDACTALDVKGHGSSDRLMFFVNRVAERVGKKYPDKKLVFLSYTPYSESPPARERPARNVTVLFAPYCWGGARSQFHPLAHDVNGPAREHFKGWTELLAPGQMIGFEYPKVYPYALYPNGALKAGIANIRTYAAQPAVRAVRYCGTPVSFGDLHRYLLSELHWTPDAGEHRLAEAFCAAYYGSAAPHLLRYHELLEETVERKPHFQRCEYYAPGLLGTGLAEKAYPLFDAAEKAVAEEPLLLERVRKEKACLLFVDLYERNLVNGRERDRVRFARKLLDFLSIGCPARLGQAGLTARGWLLSVSGLDAGADNLAEAPTVKAFLASGDPAAYLAAHASPAKADPDGARLNLSYFKQTAEQVEEGRTNRVLFVQAPGTGKESVTGVIEWLDNPWDTILRLTGRDENAKEKLGLKVLFNGQEVYSGKPDFAASGWKAVDIPVPREALRHGHNRVTLTTVGSDAADGQARLLIKEGRLLY